MNWENIRKKWIEIGMPIMLAGLVIYAIGWIIVYIVQAVLNTSYPVIRFIPLLGYLFIVIGAFSFVLVVKRV